MPLARIGQIALPVSDSDRAEVFYGETLGLKKPFRFGNLVFFDCAGVRLMLEGSAKTVNAAAGVCHYFKVDSIPDSVAELEGHFFVGSKAPWFAITVGLPQCET
jgi:methylmalonyl-CoA/ethylmalonyl-CoA epimerase